MEDVPLRDGVVLRAGEVVLPVSDAANRDPAVFPEPDDLLPDRARNPHLTFGFGPHYCLGAELARLELAVGIPAVLRAFPGCGYLSATTSCAGGRTCSCAACGSSRSPGERRRPTGQGVWRRRVWPGCTSVVGRLLSLRSWVMTVRGSRWGATRSAIVQRVSPGATTT